MDNIERILCEWEHVASIIFTPARKLTVQELRNGAKNLLVDIVIYLERAETCVEQTTTPKERLGKSQNREGSMAWEHGFTRMKQGFTVNDILSEYRALRASVTKFWTDSSKGLLPSDVYDLVRFNEAIDHALFESVSSYSSAKDYQTRQFEAMLTTSPDLYYILNLDGVFLYVNRAFVALQKKPVHNILGRAIYNEAMPSRDEVHTHIQSIIRTGALCQGEVEHLSTAGKAYCYEYILGPIFDEDGKVEAVAGISHDITTHKKNEKKFKALLEATPDGLVIIDKQGHIILANVCAEVLFSCIQDEIIGQNIASFIPRIYLLQNKMHHLNSHKRACARPMGEELGLFVQLKDGNTFPVEISLSPFDSEEGLLEIVAIRDISDRKKNDERKVLLSAMVEDSGDAIIGQDLNGIIFSWNHGAEKLYGYVEGEMIGKSINGIIPEEEWGAFESFKHKIVLGEPILSTETRHVRKDNTIISVSITLSPIKDNQSKVIGASITARDVTEQKLTEEKLRYLAEYDALTGLANRLIFEDRLSQAIALAKRHKNTIAVFFMDIDDFKKVNDIYGHVVGDLLLGAVAKRMRRSVRAVDTLARLGGDEFALILLDIKRKDNVIKVAKEIISECSKSFLIHNQKIMITLSIGISIYPKYGCKALIEKADSAMYYVKKHGKNNFKLFDNTLELNDEREEKS